MLRSMDFLRRIIALVRGQGGVTLSYACFHCHRFPLADYIWWVSLTSGTASKIRGERCGWGSLRRSVQLEGPEKILFYTGRCGPSDAKGFLAHVFPLPLSHRMCVCENLVLAIKLLVNLQKGGDNLVDTTCQGLLEQRQTHNH